MRFRPAVLALLFWVVPARAQDNAAVAQSLFEEARALMAEGRYAEACPKLEESNRLDSGGGTLLNLAACHDKLGKTATAWAEYNEALGMARRDGRSDREREAVDRIRELTPRLSRIRVDVDPRNPASLAIELDDAPLGRAVWGTPFAVNPGKHRLLARAPNRKELVLTVTVGARGGLQGVSVPLLDVLGPPEMEREQRAATPPPSALVALGVGVIGLGTGSYFALKARSEKHDSDALCDREVCPTGQDRAVELNDRARRDAWIANVGFGVGLIATGAGIYLWTTADAPRVDGLVTRDGAHVTIRGAF